MIGNALTALDGALAFLPAWVRLALYGGVAGGGAMLLYGWLSPQERLEEIQTALREVQGRMRGYDGDDFGEMSRLFKASLALSFRQVAIVFLPTLMSAAPILLAIVWLDGAFAHELPAAGTPVTVEYITAAGAEPAPESPVSWPTSSDPLTLHGPSGVELLTLPLDYPQDRVSRRTWWHDVFGDPAGYLPARAKVAAVALGLPDRHFLPMGPGWLRGWHAVFLTALSIAAVAVKVGRGIR